MLEIVLMILKIVGIILAAVLGILIAAVTLVLFVPVRYHGDFSAADEEDGDGKKISAAFRIFWLLRLVRVYVTWEKTVRVRVKVFLFTLFDTAKEKKAGKKKSKNRKDKTGQGREDSSAGGSPGRTPESGGDIENGGTELSERNPKSCKTESDSKIEVSVEGREGKADDRADHSGEDREGGGDGKSEIPGGDAEGDEAEGSREDRKGSETEDGSIRKEKRSIKRLISNILQTIRDFCDKLRGIREKLEKIEELWISDHMVSSRSLLGRQLIYLLKHTKPGNLEGYLRFGFEDPSTTGYAMAAYGILYPIWSPKLSVEPDFEKQVLAVQIRMKGKLRAWHFLRAVLRMYLSKDVRRVIRDVKKL